MKNTYDSVHDIMHDHRMPCHPYSISLIFKTSVTIEPAPNNTKRDVIINAKDVS